MSSVTRSPRVTSNHSSPRPNHHPSHHSPPRRIDLPQYDIEHGNSNGAANSDDERPSTKRIRSESISSISTDTYYTLENLQITRRYGNATAFTIGFFMIKLCTGAGILALPYSFDSAGVVACCLLTITLTLMSIISCRILLRSREIMLGKPFPLSVQNE